jgi:hypothetical protein
MHSYGASERAYHGYLMKKEVYRGPHSHIDGTWLNDLAMKQRL